MTRGVVARGAGAATQIRELEAAIQRVVALAESAHAQGRAVSGGALLDALKSPTPTT